MKRVLKYSLLFLAASLVLGFAGCDLDWGNTQEETPGQETPGGDNNPIDDDAGVSFVDHPNGTLSITNGASEDMVIFYGQTPANNTILGGVRAGTTRNFDVSFRSDFGVGGWMILRGIKLSEYRTNRNSLSNAKIEYSAMATYREGQRFSTAIQSDYMGDYAIRVNNVGRLGVELRKNSPDGEKIGYVPALAQNNYYYFNSSNQMTIFPVFVYYDNVSKTVNTLRATSMLESQSVGPRAGTSIPTVRFPNDNDSWNAILGTLVSPVAYVTVQNNTNQGGQVERGTTPLISQNGYDSLNSGEISTFEVTATSTGVSIMLNITFYGGDVTIPVKTVDGETPVFINGYDYTITVEGAGGDAASYIVTFEQSENARDLEAQIEAL